MTSETLLTGVRRWQAFIEGWREADLDAAVPDLVAGTREIERGSEEARLLVPQLIMVSQTIRRVFLDYGLPKVLEHAIAIIRAASDVVAEGSPREADVQLQLSTLLLDRMSLARSDADITAALDAIDRARRCIDGDDWQAFAASALNLGNVRREQWYQTGDVAFLDASIAAYEEGVARPSINQRSIQSQLSAELNSRWHVRGDSADARRALDLARCAVDGVEPDDPHLSEHLQGLANALHTGFIVSGDLGLLEEAIAYGERAVEASRPKSYSRRRALNTLSLALTERWDRTHDVNDLERSAAALTEVIRDAPATEPMLGRYLFNQARAIEGLGRARRDGELLALVPRILEQATKLPPATPADAASQRIYLAAVRLEQAGSDEAELTQAVLACEDALSAVQSRMPDLVMGAEANLANALRLRFALTGDPNDRDRAIDLYRHAFQARGPASWDVVFAAGRTWGNWALSRDAWDEAIVAYSAALEAAESLRTVQLSRRGKESWLREVQHLPARLAFAHARANDLGAAVLALENGRAVILAQAIERDRADLTRIEVTHPDLVAAYRSASEHMVVLERELGLRELAPNPSLLQRAWQARRDLESAIAALRAIPGYERFLEPPESVDVSGMLGPDEALVYFATTPRGTAVLEVTQAGIAVEWSNLDDALVRSLLFDPSEGRPSGSFMAGQSPVNVPWLASGARAIARKLGDVLMAPLAARLRARGVRRVVLVPSGLASALPLHAAWTSEDPNATPFHEEFVVRIAPNARVLRRPSSALDDRWLGVGDPEPHRSPLPAAGAELSCIERMFAPDRRTLLRARDARRREVLAEMPRATLIHFACHGVFHARDPLSSELQLGDGECIRLADFLAGDVRASETRLVVLSACQSALVELDQLPDELIGFPTALLEAGVHGVVGTLWPVDDLTAFLVFRQFYRLMLHPKTPLPGPDALAEALKWLRTITADELCTLGEELANEFPDVGRSFQAAFGGDEPEKRPFERAPVHFGAFVYMGQ